MAESEKPSPSQPPMPPAARLLPRGKPAALQSAKSAVGIGETKKISDSGPTVEISTADIPAAPLPSHSAKGAKRNFIEASGKREPSGGGKGKGKQNPWIMICVLAGSAMVCLVFLMFLALPPVEKANKGNSRSRNRSAAHQSQPLRLDKGAIQRRRDFAAQGPRTLADLLEEETPPDSKAK